MEMTAYSLSCAKASYLSPPIFAAKSSTVVARSTSVNFLGCNNCPPRKFKFSARKLGKFGAIRASDESGNSTAIAIDSPVRWILQPIGDGDFRHIGYKTAMPGAFEIASDVVTVGRVREKADIVISVPTVSGLHARIRKTEENLLITDLDSTNGTFIDEKRLQPGIVYPASPGDLVIFGDANLAIFIVNKLEKEAEEESDAKLEDEPSSKLD